ncbi:MAG: hypothetical protein ACYSYU_09805, partial [Planctomycetota bacterium]
MRKEAFEYFGVFDMFTFCELGVKENSRRLIGSMYSDKVSARARESGIQTIKNKKQSLNLKVRELLRSELSLCSKSLF